MTAKSLIPFTAGQNVCEVTGNLDQKGKSKVVRVTHNDDVSCWTETGHRYCRKTGRCLDRTRTYRAIHSPAYTMADFVNKESMV